MRDHIPAYYQRLFDQMQILSEWTRKVDIAASLVYGARDVYTLIGNTSQLPWWIIGAIHLMEASCNFEKNLLNGQPLNQVTTKWPKGRGPWKTWIDMADEVFDRERYRWSDAPVDLANALHGIEGWNGRGYAGRGKHSPYLWSGCQFGQFAGKFVADGQYDVNAVSDQVGAAVVIKKLLEKEA